MRHRFLVVLLVVLLLPLQVLAADVQGRVVGVHDGDTFTLLQIGNQQIKVRLAEIDTPESKQPYGNKAKQELFRLIFGKTVTVNIQDTDRYGRTVGRVFVDTLDVNAEMIRRGAAWVYRKYAKDQTLYQLEAQAKQEKRGLWNLPDSERVPPWEWRHAKHGNTSTRTPDTTKTITLSQSGGGFTCAEKQTCGQMTSCAEAHFYLEQCGISSLDGNHDGTPCSKLCR
jgi:endonuclease YncB( thermonuclease family)